MEWNRGLIEYWCEHYYALRDYELNPFEQLRIIENRIIVTGSSLKVAPYEDTCDLNWEFDKALKKLGGRAKLFRDIYLDGEEPTKESEGVYEEFCRILMESNNES